MNPHSEYTNYGHRPAVHCAACGVVCSHAFVETGGQQFCYQCWQEQCNKAAARIGESIKAATVERGADAIQVGGEHYRGKTVQPWAAMEAWMSKEEFTGFLRGNVIKYVARCSSKGKLVEDLKKAQHYLTKLIETLEMK